MPNWRLKALMVLAAAAALVAPATITPASAATVTASSAGTTRVDVTANVWGTALGAEGRAVWTEVRLADGSWSKSQQRTAAADGTYVIPLTYGSNVAGTTTWRVAASTPAGVVRSATLTLTRTGWVSSASAGTKQAGLATNAWGTAHGAANRPVWTEVRMSDGRWVKSQQRTASSSGGYSIPLTYGSNVAGKYTYRVAASTATGIVRSNEFVLTRTGWVTATSAGKTRTGVDSYTWGTAHGALSRSVWTEVKLPDGSWAKSQQRTTGTNGSFSIPLTFGKATAGTYTFRVAASTSLGVVRSNPFTLTREGLPLDLSMAATWDRIAQCESGGNWSINTGNGYYGGLQFNYQTWHSVDGGDFATYPHQATRDEQITVANRLHDLRGFQPWSCA